MSVTYESVLQESSKNRAKAYAFKNIYPAYIILVIALAASVAFWQFMENKVESDNRTEFEKSLFSLQSRFQMALDEHIGIARSMKGLYDINSYVVRDMFELYGSIPVKTYPSIQTVGFATRVPFADIQNHISYAQSERYWTYSIHPPGKRDVYYPVLYIVPLDRNLSISGYDLGTKEEMLEAIKLSGEKSTISATSVFSLRGDSLQGFVLFAPIYKPQDPFNTKPLVQSESTLNGIVFIEIIANEFIAYALGGGESTDKQIMFAVSDDRGREFYRSENYNAEQVALFQQNETLEIQNKQFILKVQSVPEFGSGFSALIPLITLAGSVVTSFLLFGFTVTTLTGRARAQEIAARITKSQRRIVETSRDIIGITDINGVWKSINPAATVIFGFTDREFIGTSLYEKMSGDYGAKLQKLVETAPEEGKIMNEVLMPTRDGDMRWISWNVSVSREDGLLYLIGRDITEQKLAEERIKLKSRQVELSRQFTSEAANFQSRFMTDVSFFFRTSITGILGYLELLVTKQYSSEDDLEFFVSEAYTSAEQLLSRTSDLVDVVDGEDEKAMFTIKPKALPPAETFESIQQEITTNLSEQTISFDGSIDAAPEYKIFADKTQLSNAMTEVIGSLTAGMPTAHVDYMLQANPYENVIEIQLLVSGNQLASDIISLIGKTSKNDMIEALANDKENIMYRIAEASSRLRMMNGSLQVNVLGDGENVAMIALPLKKTISLASLKAKKQ